MYNNNIHSAESTASYNCNPTEKKTVECRPGKREIIIRGTEKPLYPSRVQKRICTRRTRQTCSPYFFYLLSLHSPVARVAYLHAYTIIIYINIHFFLLRLFFFFISTLSRYKQSVVAAAYSLRGGACLAFVLAC